MAGITLQQAQANLDAWIAADIAVASAQEYRIKDRYLTRADAGEIRRNIEYWNQQVKRLSAGGIRIRSVTPV